MTLKRTLFEGENEIDQLNKIFQLLGTPNFNNIPYYINLNINYNKFIPFNPADFDQKFNCLDKNGKDLLMKMLNYDPDMRISCKDALAHPYFSNKNESQNNTNNK